MNTINNLDHNPGLGSETGQSSSSFFQRITITHGSNTAQKLKKWLNSRRKQREITHQLNLLKDCKLLEVVPSHIHNTAQKLEKLKFRSKSCKDCLFVHIHKLSKKILKLEILYTK